MSKDTIYRADAVSEIHKYFFEEIEKTPHGTDEDGEDVYTDMSAVNSLLAHNKQLSKRIKALTSAQPELDEWCTDCKEYDQEQHCCPRWNKVIRETLKDAQPEPHWIPCSERLPEDKYVLISKKPTKILGDKWSVAIAIRTADPRSGKIEWRDSGFGVIQDDKVLAWMPLPEPYQEGEQDD